MTAVAPNLATHTVAVLSIATMAPGLSTASGLALAVPGPVQLLVLLLWASGPAQLRAPLPVLPHLEQAQQHPGTKRLVHPPLEWGEAAI